MHFSKIINPLASKLSILLCLTPDDFTRQWGTPGSQWVNQQKMICKKITKIMYGILFRTFLRDN